MSGFKTKRSYEYINREVQIVLKLMERPTILFIQFQIMQNGTRIHLKILDSDKLFLTFKNRNSECTSSPVAISINKYIGYLRVSDHKEWSWSTTSWCQVYNTRVISGSWFSPRNDGTSYIEANFIDHIFNAVDNWWNVIIINWN